MWPKLLFNCTIPLINPIRMSSPYFDLCTQRESKLIILCTIWNIMCQFQMC